MQKEQTKFQRGVAGTKEFLARNFIDPFRFKGPGMGLELAGAGGPNIKASEFSRYHKQPPKNVMADLTDCVYPEQERSFGEMDGPGSFRMPIHHSELKQPNPYGRALTAIILVDKHDGRETGALWQRKESLRNALQDENNPKAASVILVTILSLAKEAGESSFTKEHEKEILDYILSLDETKALKVFSRHAADNGWREEYGSFDDAVRDFSAILARAKESIKGDTLGKDYPKIQQMAAKIDYEMFEAQRKIGTEKMPLYGFAAFSFTVTCSLADKKV